MLSVTDYNNLFQDIKKRKNILNGDKWVGLREIGNSHSTQSNSIWSIFIIRMSHCHFLLFDFTWCIWSKLRPFLRCHQSPATGNWSTSKSFQQDGAQNAFSEVYLVFPLWILIYGWQDLSRHSYIIHTALSYALFLLCAIKRLPHGQ